MGDAPLVSCLCVTRQRASLLRRALGCYRNQDVGARELVVVFESDDTQTRELLASVPDSSIRACEVAASPKHSLGALRNFGISQCRGRFIAQWDDDDWSAPSRLRAQLAAIDAHRVAGCVLARWILYDATLERAYLSAMRAWEGSLVVERSAAPVYADLSKGEDTPAVSALLASGSLVLLDQPSLYIYVFHGENTWDRDHFERNLLQHASRLPRQDEVRVRECLTKAP